MKLSRVLVLALYGLSSGCTTEETVDWCDTNVDCEAKIVSGAIPGSDKICQPNAHVCYPGCRTDSDCRAVKAFSELMICDPADGQCKLQEEFIDSGADSSRDAGPDSVDDQSSDQLGDATTPDIARDTIAPDLGHDLGVACKNANECRSRNCVDGVCCQDSSCPGKCNRCEAGTGLCTLVADGQDPDSECGSGVCAGVCNGNGGCRWPNANQECAQSCGADPTKLQRHICATDADTCDTTTVNSTTDCGPCKRCDQPVGQNATCKNVQDGRNPDDDCGDSQTNCAGSCQAGSCANKAPSTTRCAATCNADGLRLDERFCKDGQCDPVPVPRSCDEYKCNAAANACYDRCSANHQECIDTSVCDRSRAHNTGSGVCVDPMNVYLAANDGQLTTGLSSGKQYIRLTGPSYSTARTVSSQQVSLIGSPGVTVFSPGTNTAFSVTGNASNRAQLTLQGVTVQLGAIAVDCSGSPPTLVQRPSVTLIETELLQNGTGLKSDVCDVTVRRTTLRSNTGGGLDLDTGVFVITNSVIESNGQGGLSGSPLGGAAFTNPLGQTQFINNTVYNNSARDGLVAGVECSQGSTTLENSILQNSGTEAGPTCTIGSTTNTMGTCQLALVGGRIVPGSTGPCVNAGAAITLRLDRDNVARNQTTPDLGAFEIP
jgi:hypothetical protein